MGNKRNSFQKKSFVSGGKSRAHAVGGRMTLIRRMAGCIVRKFHPEKIILFGSHARGHARADSDVDLLVVMSVAGSKRRRQLEIRSSLRRFAVPKDIIVSRPEEFEWRKNVPGTIERPAMLEGKVLYARS